MKRIISILLSLSLGLCLSACGGDTQEQPSTSPQAPAESSGGSIEVDQKLFDVELTIPADFIDGGTTQESLDEEVEESGFRSATLNEDGSVTYVMTNAQHDEMMSALRDSIDASLAEMVGSEDYPTFTSVTANDDYTEFTVETTSETLNLVESFSVLAFYMYGGMYHAFNGTQVDDITVQFVNEKPEK